MKKIQAASLATALCMVCALSACGETNYQFDVPSYDEDMEITIGVWNGSHFDLSETPSKIPTKRLTWEKTNRETRCTSDGGIFMEES